MGINVCIHPLMTNQASITARICVVNCIFLEEDKILRRIEKGLTFLHEKE